jgi:hypothetical protein
MGTFIPNKYIETISIALLFTRQWVTLSCLIERIRTADDRQMTYIMRLLFVVGKWRGKWCCDSKFVPLVNFTEMSQVHLTGV